MSRPLLSPATRLGRSTGTGPSVGCCGLLAPAHSPLLHTRVISRGSSTTSPPVDTLWSAIASLHPVWGMASRPTATRRHPALTCGLRPSPQSPRRCSARLCAISDPLGAPPTGEIPGVPILRAQFNNRPPGPTRGHKGRSWATSLVTQDLVPASSLLNSIHNF